MISILILFIIFLILVLLGIPIAFSMGISAAVILILNADVPYEIIIQRMFVGIDSLSLLAIPFFVVAGDLMVRGGISTRLVQFASNIVASFRGGLAMASVVASMIFAGISGSALADTTAVGSVTMPAMIKKGYKKPFVAALQACAGTIGPIIPPSIIMIIYGSLTGISIGALFLAGIIPGVLIGLSLITYCYIYAKKENIPLEPRVTFKQILKSGLDSIWALLLPFVIIGGIISGFFTATEAGMVAVIYALIVGIFVYKELKWSMLVKIFAESAMVTASIMIIASIAAIFGWVLAYSEFPKMAVKLLTSLTSDPTMAMFYIVIFFLILGLFVESVSAVIIFVPVLAPVVMQFHYDPIHFALVVIVTLMIGLVTPPVGVLLSVTTSMINTTIVKTLPYTSRMVLLMLTVVVLMVLFPYLVTIIPRLIFG